MDGNLSYIRCKVKQKVESRQEQARIRLLRLYLHRIESVALTFWCNLSRAAYNIYVYF